MLRGLLFLALYAGARAEIDESGVVVLGDDNFDKFVKDNPRVLVEFYAPWCGHCKSLKPKWAEAALELNADASIGTKLAMVDATANQASAGKHGVSGYPTIKYFDNGEVSDYQGPRDTAGIVSWVKTRARPVVSQIKKKDVDSFATSDDFAVIGFFKKDSKKGAKFERTAKKNRERYTFGQVTLKKGKSRVLFRRKGFSEDAGDGPETIKYEGGMSKLTSWLDDNQFRLFSEIGGKVSLPALYNAAKEGSVGAIVICEESDNFDDRREAFKEFAVAHTNEGARVGFLDWGSSESQGREIGCDGPGQVVVVDDKGNASPGKQNKYAYSGEFKKADLEAFFEKVKKGEAERWIKSEDVPEGESFYGTGGLDEGIEVLVGSTFVEATTDQKSDILVEFYAPWCGHCKKFKPDYEKLARKVKRYWKNKPIRLAKIDATANEVDAPVKGFPTIVFYPGGKMAKNGEHIKYEGNRDEEDLLEFLEENAWSHTLDYKEEL